MTRLDDLESNLEDVLGGQVPALTEESRAERINGLPITEKEKKKVLRDPCYDIDIIEQLVGDQKALRQYLAQVGGERGLKGILSFLLKSQIIAALASLASAGELLNIFNLL